MIERLTRKFIFCKILNNDMRMSINSGSIIIRLEFYFIPLLPFASNRSAQTFNALFYTPNVYVWLTKRVRLAGKTCTFGQQNVYVCPTKRTRLAFKITSLGRG